jgi:YebC/PmpR family DNA-binding regulatory protein
MAGHSKFKNIMHRKGAQDAKRARMFSRLGREIQVAARTGGGDPDMNPRLRIAIQNAKAVSMPKDRIDKAIQTGVGGNTGDDYESMRYEGYGMGGVAIIVETLTNNKNRTAGDIRSTFSKYDGNMGATGSVGFMFDRIGEIVYPAGVSNADVMFEAALEAGAQNVESDPDAHTITTQPDDFAAARTALVAKFGEPEKSGLTWKPNLMTQVNEEQAQSVLKLIEMLEDNDDVQTVITNFEVSDAVMQKLTASG